MNKDTSGSSSASKDIVYIDVEDDVTSVIGKVRNSSQKIVALVPPKNIGALQSAVNLRLLLRAADNAGKRIVLITNNSGLTALAAGVKIPVAKNLQSKPEIPVAPEMPAGVEEDVIKGEELPVGELAAATAGASAVEENIAPKPLRAPKSADDDITIADLPDLDKPVVVASATNVAKRKSSGSKVPNFGRFRKWIFILIALIVAIVLFFVLGNIFWTKATIVITAQTTSEAIDTPLTISTTGATNTNTDTIQAVSKSVKKTQTVSFTPTGMQNLGKTATGTVKFSTNSFSGLGTIPAGTKLTADSDNVYTTDNDVTLTATNHSGATTTVTAVAQGASYNGDNGAVTGAPSDVTAAFTDDTAGGTDNNVTVVTNDDITKATAQLTGTSADTTSIKSQLKSEFGSDYLVLTDSFGSATGNPTSSPAVGQQASSAKLSVDVTYTMTGIAKSQIKVITSDYLKSQMSGSNQKIYDDGSSSATYSQFATSPSGVQTLDLKATGKIGPNIDDTTIKNQSVGKKVQEIKQSISATQGVKNVTVSIAPFWKTTAPSADKINVSFDISN